MDSTQKQAPALSMRATDRPAHVRASVGTGAGPRWLLLFWVAALVPVLGLAEQREPFPPFHIEKIAPGQPFFSFRLTDLENRRWHLAELRGKPVVILTGHQELRYDLQRWARELKHRFADSGAIHLLWVVNLSRHRLTDRLEPARREWLEFGPIIPCALDPHSQVSRGLKIDYDIPSIIGIDGRGILAFHDMFPCNHASMELVGAKIRALLRPVPAK